MQFKPFESGPAKDMIKGLINWIYIMSILACPAERGVIPSKYFSSGELLRDLLFGILASLGNGSNRSHSSRISNCHF